MAALKRFHHLPDQHTNTKLRLLFDQKEIRAMVNRNRSDLSTIEMNHGEVFHMLCFRIIPRPPLRLGISHGVLNTNQLCRSLKIKPNRMNRFINAMSKYPI